MITVEASAVIEMGIDEVFEFVSNPINDPKWHTDIVEVHIPADEAVVAGTIFTVVVRFLGLRTQTVEVTDLQSGRLIEYTTKDGTIRPVATCLMEPVDGGTRLTRRVALPLSGFLRVLSPAIQSSAQKRQAQFVENLKRLLEP